MTNCLSYASGAADTSQSMFLSFSRLLLVSFLSHSRFFSVSFLSHSPLCLQLSVSLISLVVSGSRSRFLFLSSFYHFLQCFLLFPLLLSVCLASFPSCSYFSHCLSYSFISFPLSLSPWFALLVPHGRAFGGTALLLSTDAGWAVAYVVPCVHTIQGCRNALTPCHYDLTHNAYVQVCGWKRFVLFDPAYGPCLYPFPVAHPMDRCARVDLEHVDLQRFPRLASARAVAVVLGPGDLLVIPAGWWHHVQTLTEDSVSVSFWFADVAPSRSSPRGPGGGFDQGGTFALLAFLRKVLS